MTQLEVSNDSILEIKEQHVSACHWPSSGFILKVMLQECYTVIAIIIITLLQHNF